MEIYLNVIELGPGIYGVGQAARHYFGKLPRDLNPLEAAFFATLLPSPKRRYVQYCRGELTPRWDAYVRRVLLRMAAKGFLSKLDLETAEAHQLVFNRDTLALSEEECKAQVRTLVEAWQREHQARLRAAVLRAAPHQIKMYIGD
jgi:membrane peptidoglycan carboxypeptidase